MWKFTEVADWFDNLVKEDQHFLDGVFTDMMAKTQSPDSSWYGNTLRYIGVGAGYSTFKLSTEVAKGFVDVLRLGDGVQKGGWGYAQDGLRLLMVAGPVLRGGRALISAVAAVDETVTVGNCGWIAAARALRMTGVKHFAKLADILAGARDAGVAYTPGLETVGQLEPVLKAVGADASVLSAPSTLAEVAKAARANTGGLVMFGIRWQGAGHVLVAYASPVLRTVKFLDRSGRVVSDLSELTPLYGPGIASAIPSGGMMLVKNSALVWAMGTLPTMANVVGLEVRSIEIPAPKHLIHSAVKPTTLLKPNAMGKVPAVPNVNMSPVLSPLETQVYKVLDKTKPLMFNDVAKLTGLSEVTASQALQSLKAKNMIVWRQLNSDTYGYVRTQ